MNADEACWPLTLEAEAVREFHPLRSRLQGLSRCVCREQSDDDTCTNKKQELVLRVDRIESGELTVEQNLSVEL
jgi:hypothetical protein